jgi:membrane-bound lytic murein transglycosylase MltF
VIPFCYFNNQGDLIGFDVSYVYQLAHDLNVKLELISYEWQNLSRDLQTGRFDLAISGIYVTTERLESLGVTQAYYESPVALIVRSDQATRFVKGASVAAMPQLKLAAFAPIPFAFLLTTTRRPRFPRVPQSMAYVKDNRRFSAGPD